MATKLTDEEIEEMKKKITKEQNTPKDLLTENDYKKKIEELGKEEGWDYLKDYDTVKNSLLSNSYSPRTNKVYSYDDAQNLSYKQYWDDILSNGNHGETPMKDFMNKVADLEIPTGVLTVPGLITKAQANLIPERIIQNYVYGANEATGGTLAYKTIKGVGALADVVKNAVGGDQEAQKQLSEMKINPWLGPILGNSIVQSEGQKAIDEKTRSLANEYGGSGTTASRTIGNVLGAVTTFAGGSAAGSLAGPALGTTASVGSKLGVIGASGLSSGAKTATYTDNPVDIYADAVKGVATTATFIGVSTALRNAFPIYTTAAGKYNYLANTAKNVGIGAASGYTSTTAGNLVENAKKGIKGEDVTAEDWLNTFISPEHVISTAFSAIGYGVQGYLADRATVKNNLAQAMEHSKQLEDALGRGAQSIENNLKSGNVQEAIAQYNQGKAYINMLRAMEYKGVQTNPQYFIDKTDQWDRVIGALFRQYEGTLPGEGVLSNVPTTTGNYPIVPTTLAGGTTPIQSNAIANTVAGVPNVVASQNQNASSTDLTTAKLSEDRLNRIIAENTTKWHPDYGKAYVVKMTPDEFLEATTSSQGLERIKKETEPLDPAKLSDESQHIFLSVDMKDKEITGHEGRHRVQALKNAGVKEIDVVIYPNESSYDKYNAQNISELPLKGQYQGTDKSGKEIYAKDVTLKNLDAVTFRNIDYLKQKYLDTTNDDKSIRYSQNPGYKRIHIIKPMSKETNPNWDEDIVVYDDKDNEIKLSDYKDVIENSMSMKEAEEMIKRAYILDKEEHAFGTNKLSRNYKSLNKVLNEAPEFSIARTILQHGDLVDKYVNPIKEFKETPMLIEGVVRAYKNKALKGKLPTRNPQKVDTSKDYGALKNADKRKFYETGYSQKEEKNTSKEAKLFAAIKEQPNGFNNSEIRRARREFVIKAHDKKWLKDNKISLKQANEYIEEWTLWKKPSMELSNKLNRGVAPENRWIGIENSTILSNGTFGENDLRELGINLKGRKNEKLETYIVNTILAIDTHETWHGMEIECETGLFDGNTGAEYDYIYDRIDVYQNAQDNVSHEMGHRLDHHWANTIFGRLHHGTTNYGYLTQRVTDDCLDKLLFTEDERNFVKHFYDFLDDIGHNTTFKNSYTIDDAETFARFISKFVDWTFKKAGNNIGETDNDWYRDTFTEKQFKEFVKILQEKSALDQKLAIEEQTKEFKDFQSVQRSIDAFATSYRGDAYLGTFKELILDSFNDGKSSKEDFLKRIFENKEKYIEDDKKYAGENREYLINSRRDFFSKINKSVYMEHALGMIYDRLKENLEEANVGKSKRIGKDHIGDALKRYFNYDSFLRPRNIIRTLYNKNPGKNLTVEKQNKDLERANKANEQLRNKLAKEKEKSKEITKKKNEEKKEAIKAEREKAKTKLGALKTKQKEQLQDIKLRARATTTDKKMRLAGKKLERALNKAYDKPAGKELDEALDLVRKSTRGAIKLINNVKNKLPSSYSPFVDDVKEIVETIYTGANTMTDEKRASLEKKAQAIRKFIEEHPEYPVSQRALDLLKEPSKKNITDLNAVDLMSMAEDVAEIGIAVRDMFAFSRASEDAMKLREEAIKYAKEIRATGKTRSNDSLPKLKLAYNASEFARNYVDKRSTIKTMVLRLAGGNPNSPFKFINEQLMNGYERYNVATERLLKVWDKFANVTKLGNIRIINNKLNHLFNPTNYLDVDLKTTSGKTYKPSVRDAISVVLGVKDPQFAGHTTGVLTDQFDKQGNPLMSSGGIARFANNIDAKYGNQSLGLKRGVNVKLTMDDVNKMKAELYKLPYVKELMDAFKEFSDLTYQLTNESYEAINGMSLEKRDYYFPISSDPATRVRQKATDKLKEYSGIDASTTLLNASIVKPVVQGANNQILIYPIDEVIGKMLGDTAMYSGYATALYDINTFLSGRTEDGETLIQLIDDIDPRFLSNYNKITNSIINGTGHPNRSNIASRYTTSILKANPWLALKQAGSYFTVSKYYDHPFRSMVAGAFFKKNIAKTIREYYKQQGTDLSKLNTDQVLRYLWNDKINAEIDTRARGWNLATKNQLLKYNGILKRINALDFYKGVDYSTVRAIAFAMVYDTILSGNFEFGDDKYFTEVQNKFMLAHPETQPNSSGVTRAPIQSGNWLDMALSYMADPRIKTLNMLMDARLENKYYKDHGTKEEKHRAKRNYAHAILGTLGSLAFITAVARAKKQVQGKDDGKGIKGFLKDMFGNGIALSIGIEQLTGRFIDEYSFDVELPDTQAINIILGAVDDFEKLYGYIQKGKDNKIPGAVSKVIGDISRFVGIPYQNLESIYNDLLAATGSDLYWENKIKADDNAYKKYQKYEDKITNYEEFYKLYKATRETAVKDTYGKYNDANVKKAITDNGGSLKEYFNILKRGS